MIFFAIGTFSFSSEEIQKVLNPSEIKVESSYSNSGNTPKEIEGLQWNRWTSKNFVVLALNDSYAKYLNKHLELVKTWTLCRWGLIDVDFSSPCKFICVDDPILFEKLFNLKKTKVEIRRDENNKIKETVIFLLANNSPSHSVPGPLTDVCVAEFAQKYDLDFKCWTYHGMSVLNGPINLIKDKVVDVKKSMDSGGKIYLSKELLEYTKNDYLKLSESEKQIFDSFSTTFCIMIRKEFGEDNFHHLMKDSIHEPQDALTKCTGFESYNDFDKTFKRYVDDLSKDMLSGKAPDSYFQIYESVK